MTVVLHWVAPSNIGGSAITNYNIYRGFSSGTETYLNTTWGSFNIHGYKFE